MKDARLIPRRRAALYALLATLLGVASLTLSQCTMVGDNLTGVGLTKDGPTTCIKQCNDLYSILYNDEQKLHDTNVNNCQALPQPDKGTCLVNEDARHQAAKDALTAGKIDCQNNCHRQGSGSAG